MLRFLPGDFLPDFQADSSVNPRFVFNTLGGRRFLLAFVGTVRSDLGRKLAEALLADAAWLAQRRILVYVVTMDSRTSEDPLLARLLRRFTVFWDHDRAIARQFGMEVAAPTAPPATMVLRLGVLLASRNLRLHAAIQVAPIEAFGARLRGAVDTLPELEAERLVQSQAPVLIIPDVLDAAACRLFIDHYERHGGVESGFMRDVDGRTQGMLDPGTKRRKDLYIKDPELQSRLRAALTGRVLPEIRKAYAYEVSRVERYLIGCYDDADRGFFGAHRDNVSKATVHRTFALSLNLNSEDYEGGELRFPEYGPHTYKPATGCAVVFSCSLLHEALPVKRGRRYVILPFLYDETAAARRAENVQFLNDGPPLRIGETAHA